MQPVDTTPLVSLVVPARNCAEHLRLCLKSVELSAYGNFEVIVVDDASTDSTADIAERAGATVIKLERQRGPAEARNRGAWAARGAILLFVDADVCIRPDTIARVVTAFADNPEVDAIFGSYDSRPAQANFVSQYKNLAHHFIHQAGKTEATTFWSGCGAIRRDTFIKVGGFDGSFRRPCIEDIELGMRLARAGHRIVLVKQLQVTHCKRWTFWNMLCSDVFDRALPWTALICREESLVNDLNLAWSQRISVCLAQVLAIVHVLYCGRAALSACRWLTGDGAGGIAAPTSLWFGMSLMLVGAIVLLNRSLYSFFWRHRSFWFMIRALPLHLCYFWYSGAAFQAGLALAGARNIALNKNVFMPWAARKGRVCEGSSVI